MKLLGTLRARLLLESEDFRRGMKEATKRVDSFEKRWARLRKSMVLQVASIAAVSYTLKRAIEVANEYDKAERQLAATARLTGSALDSLNEIAAKGEEQFSLSRVNASGFAIELSKLAKNAGDASTAGDALAAVLDLGAARGLDASETLQRLSQVIVGIDAGFDNLIGMNASVVYKEYADAIGTTVGKLTDQQKAQAVLNRIMQDGQAVQGEYGSFLDSAAGRQYQLAQAIEQTQANIGKALQPALIEVLPHLTNMVNVVGTFATSLAGSASDAIVGFVRELEVLGARLAPLPELMAAIGAAARRDFAGFATAMQQYRVMKEAADEMVASIRSRSIPVGTARSHTTPLPSNPTAYTDAGAEAARRYFDGLKDEWERMRHEVALRGLALFGDSEAMRLDLELQHSLRMLDIEEERLRLARQRNEINDNELDVGLREIEARREIARTRHEEFKAIDKALAKQQRLLDLTDSVASLLPSPSSGPGSNIGSQAAAVAADRWLSNWEAMLGGFGAMIVPGIGGLIGGAIGSLFGGVEEREAKVISQLQAIERVQKETITAIEQQTSALLSPESRLINAPASFGFPSYSPTTTTMMGDIIINVTTQTNANADDIAKSVQRILQEQLSPRGRSRARGGW